MSEGHKAAQKRYQLSGKKAIVEKARYEMYRDAAITAYGGECNCCGEKTPAFLTIDHINGGGAEHRRSLRGLPIGNFLKKNNYPSGYRVLCWNCNAADGIRGGCPHKKA